MPGVTIKPGKVQVLCLPGLFYYHFKFLGFICPNPAPPVTRIRIDIEVHPLCNLFQEVYGFSIINEYGDPNLPGQLIQGFQ